MYLTKVPGLQQEEGRRAGTVGGCAIGASPYLRPTIPQGHEVSEATQHVFDDINPGTRAPTPPVLIVQAVHDYLIDVHDIDALADAYSAGGADVTYHRDAFCEHLLLHPLSAPMTLRWLSDRFAGRPLTDHLIRTKWPTMFNPATYLGMARLAVIAP